MNAFFETGNGQCAVALQPCEQGAENHDRVGDEAAALAAVHRTRETTHFHIDDAVPPQPVSQSWNAACEVRRVAEDDEVAGEPRPMFTQERIQIGRADLLLPFDQKL